jgi:hypothetical protein
MLGGTTREFDFAAIDDYGPNQIPVFQYPQDRETSLADVLAQRSVTSCKHKRALEDASGGALGGRKEGFRALVRHAPRSRDWKSEKRNSKLEKGGCKSES